MEYDSETGDYFYLGFINRSSNDHVHYIWRIDYAGNLNWSKAYAGSGNYFYSVVDTLQYSASNHELYYLLLINPHYVVRVNSSSGNYLGRYKINGNSLYGWHSSKCKLSNDGLAYFWNLPESWTARYIMRFNTTSSQIDRASI